jgi:hypothetical protein
MPYFLSGGQWPPFRRTSAIQLLKARPRVFPVLGTLIAG